MQYIQFESDQLTQCGNVRIVEPCHRIQPLLWDNKIITLFDPAIISPNHPMTFARPITEDTGEKVRELHSISKAPVLLEYDDAIWNLQTYIDADSHTLSQCERVTKLNRDLMKRYCDGIVVSTKRLAEEARKVTDKPILVFPNAISYHPVESKNNKIILYTGNGSRNKDVTDEWCKAIDVMRSRGYKVISTCDKIADEPFKRCNFHEFHQQLLDISPEYYIAPLHDSYLNNGRSNLKELEAWKIGAKFVGQGTPYRNSLPYDATCDDIVKAFDNAKVPVFTEEYNLNSRKYAERFVTAYSGNWSRR